MRGFLAQAPVVLRANNVRPYGIIMCKMCIRDSALRDYFNIGAARRTFILHSPFSILPVSYTHLLVAAHGDLDRIAQRRYLADIDLRTAGDTHIHDAAAGCTLAPVSYTHL